MVSLNILCSEPHNFLREFTKKTRKVHKKIFCGPSKILKNISWPINIYLKYFMPPAKIARLPSYTLNVRSLKAARFLMFKNLIALT